jgi:hypothetical protein
MSTAPGTSIREVDRTGDSGTKRWTSTIAIATPTAPEGWFERGLVHL